MKRGFPLWGSHILKRKTEGKKKKKKTFSAISARDSSVGRAPDSNC